MSRKWVTGEGAVSQHNRPNRPSEKACEKGVVGQCERKRPLYRIKLEKGPNNAGKFGGDVKKNREGKKREKKGGEREKTAIFLCSRKHGGGKEKRAATFNKREKTVASACGVKKRELRKDQCGEKKTVINHHSGWEKKENDA